MEYVYDRQQSNLAANPHRRTQMPKAHPLKTGPLSSITAAAMGEAVRRARLAAGLSQSALGDRIGASRFWVAQFEQGKPSAELGLALKAVHAVGLSLAIGISAEDVRAGSSRHTPAPATHLGAPSPIPQVSLDQLIRTAKGNRT